MKLNLGSGEKYRVGYVNIDKRRIIGSVESDITEDVCLLDYPPNSIDEIYISQLLEHFNLQNIQRLLRRFHTWLKPHSLLLVSIPNMKTIGRLLADGHSDSILFNWIYGAQDGADGMTHAWGFTEETITEELNNAGFEVIGEFEGEDDDSGFTFEGVPLSLNLVCEKI